MKIYTLYTVYYVSISWVPMPWAMQANNMYILKFVDGLWTALYIKEIGWQQIMTISYHIDCVGDTFSMVSNCQIVFIVHHKMLEVTCCPSGYDLEFFESFSSLVPFEYGRISLDFRILSIISNCKEKLKLKGRSLV